MESAVSGPIPAGEKLLTQDFGRIIEHALRDRHIPSLETLQTLSVSSLFAGNRLRDERAGKL